MRRLAVVRIKGRSKVNKRVEDTLRMLRLTKTNYCVLLDDGDTYSGMLQKVKDYVTWGEVDEKDIAQLLEKRGELAGGKRLTNAFVKERTQYKSIKDFSNAYLNFEADLKDIPGIRLFFRLHPPRKGHEGMKRTFKEGGALGYREKAKGLLHRMR